MHRAMKVKIEELKNVQGEKALILVTDGKNDIRDNPIYKGPGKIDTIRESELLDIVRGLDESFRIYTIGIGKDAKESFLSSVVNATRNPNDFHNFGEAPDKLEKTLNFMAKTLTSNVVLLVAPSKTNPDYGKETRQFDIWYNNKNISLHASKNAILGSSLKSPELSTSMSVGCICDRIGLGRVAAGSFGDCHPHVQQLLL
ncbi:MAG: hypothetical protein IPM82_07410 [Saprospiraceae bacterium]|nr:hypothetical protein [Saprospiraceae bacterium]